MSIEANSTEARGVAFVRRYFDAIERGATGAALAAFFTDDVVQEEYPNRLVPQGATRDLDAILQGAVRGQMVVAEQRFDIQNAVLDDDRIALEVIWQATLKVPIGSLSAGSELRARFGVFMALRDGRIAMQHNYDCFDPF